VPTQEQRRQETRSKLLAAARAQFSRRGYAATSVEQIAARARVTKGAFYHHFADKQSIFRAVLEETARELAAAAAAGARGKDALALFRSGCFTWLEACLDPGVQRIVLFDGPAVLGWQKWREIDWRYGLALIERGLERAMEEGRIPKRPTRTLAHLVFGAMCESAMVIARSPEPRRALSEVSEELDGVLQAILRKR
jgi:AcrR family transcriptional regulator